MLSCFRAFVTKKVKWGSNIVALVARAEMRVQKRMWWKTVRASRHAKCFGVLCVCVNENIFQKGDILLVHKDKEKWRDNRCAQSKRRKKQYECALGLFRQVWPLEEMTFYYTFFSDVGVGDERGFSRGSSLLPRIKFPREEKEPRQRSNRENALSSLCASLSDTCLLSMSKMYSFPVVAAAAAPHHVRGN